MQEIDEPKPDGRVPLNRREDFDVKIKNTKTGHVIYHDTGSDVVVVLVPGANQDQALGENYNGFSPLFIEAGYSTAAVYTDFGPMINYGRKKNNRYFHDFLDAIVERYGNKDFILFGGSNGGMTIMQAVEDNRSKSNVLALIANPTVYVPKKGVAGLPVYLRIGEKDKMGWAKFYDKVKQELTRGGALLNAKLLPVELHIPNLDHVEVLAWLEQHGIKPSKVQADAENDK